MLSFYFQVKCIAFKLTVTICLVTINMLYAKAQIKAWIVGDKVEAGPAGYHPATVLQVSDNKTSFRLHYDDKAYTDSWVEGSLIRPKDTQAKIDADAVKTGPRLGKYIVLGYASSLGAYNGYFILQPADKYEFFIEGGKSIGKGTYNFDKATSTVKWNSGPLAGRDWDGSQRFEVTREGKTHTIRLKLRTIGTNSPDLM